MAKKIGYTIAAWLFVIFAYVILASSYTGLVDITTEAADTMAATSNMSNYPGTYEAVSAFPVYVWFIPGGVGLIATVVFLKQA